MPLQDGRRSKSIEEREEEYQRVRDRIFAREVSFGPGQNDADVETQRSDYKLHIESCFLHCAVNVNICTFGSLLSDSKVNLSKWIETT